MAWASKTYTFSPSTTIASAEVNQNFDDMVDGLDTAMPSGGIIIWSGSSATIPTGWYLCDGNNGTPNLVNNFVVGATGTYAVGATGGETEHTLITAELPSHSHNFYADTSYTLQGAKSGGTQINPWDASGDNWTKGSGISGTRTAGSGTAHNNLPPYYALCYIMKS